MGGLGLAKYRGWFQALFFIVFIGLLLAASEQISSPVPSQLFLCLDPLIVLVAVIAGQPATAVFVFALVTVLVTLLFGRVFCGYACPLGTIIDQFASLSDIFKIRQGQFKKLKILPLAVLAVVLTLSFFSVTIAMIFDPISLTTRAATIAISSVRVMLGQTTSNTSGALFGQGSGDFRGRFGNEFDGGFGMSADTPMIVADSGWILLFFAFIIGLNLLGTRFWCRYLCPLGALLGLAGRIPLLRRKVDAEACTSCMRCAKSCDMKAVSGKGKATDASSCLLCLECAKVCPKKAISTGLKPELTTEIPSRRTALAVIGGTVAAAALAPLDSQASIKEPALIRPPGVTNEEMFLSKCIRCGECIAACPTSVLQPAFLQYGVGALWTPHLEFETGSCNYSCNACVSVCPTGAIEYLDLEKKKSFIIGTAVIDQNTCIRCGICARVCPVPGGAISFGDIGARTGGMGMRGMRGGAINVDSDKCIGCGICVEVCPMHGVKAVSIVRSGMVQNSVPSGSAQSHENNDTYF